MSMKSEAIPPGRYRHFKGQEYLVLGLAQHSETEEWQVVYHPIDRPDSWWVRPLTMFNEIITREGYSGPRFRRIPEDNPADQMP